MAVEEVACPRWVILDRVALMWPEDREKMLVSLNAPPAVSNIILPTSIQDKHPTVVAANAAGLLVLVQQWPSVEKGLCGKHEAGFLVVVPLFRRVEPTGRTEDPLRVQPMPRISNVVHVGLLSVSGSGAADHIIAELQVVDADRARLLYSRSGNAWGEKDLPIPDTPGRHDMRDFHDVVAHDGKLWWINLDWGLLSCNPFDDHPELRYTTLPAAIRGDYPLQPVDTYSFVGVSDGLLRYVQMIRAKNDPVEATRVAMWSLDDGRPWWCKLYETSLEEMWAWNSYRETGMPEEVPSPAVVHPGNPDVLYFFLRHYLFGVDMQERDVEFVNKPCELVGTGEGWRLPHPSWRYVLAWELPPSLSEVLDNVDVEGCGSSATATLPYVTSTADMIEGE